ncbi:hypothetical protein EV360DRAFT_74507 [Lentinula raphanica]|nr:hypothetical protein EV360DRAFT_74507 [Lentinula raphanica]
MNIYTNFDLRPLCSDHEEMRLPSLAADAAVVLPSSGPQCTQKETHRVSPSPPRNPQTSPAVFLRTSSLRSFPSFSSEFEYNSSRERGHLARFLPHQPSPEYDSDSDRSTPTTHSRLNGTPTLSKPSSHLDNDSLQATSAVSPKRERGPPALVFEQDSDDDDLLIPKPPGEVGRLNRGGYSLFPVLGWPKKKYDKVKLFINDLVEKHLDCTAPMSDQPLESVKKVRAQESQAVEKFIFLKDYRGLWVVDDFIQREIGETHSRSSSSHRDS